MIIKKLNYDFRIAQYGICNRIKNWQINRRIASKINYQKNQNNQAIFFSLLFEFLIFTVST
jgi:hypothetical protein